MHAPELPDWAVYAAVVAALVIAAGGRREKADAPEAPPPVPGEEDVPLGPTSPFDPAEVVRVQSRVAVASGTAFSVGQSGVWVTARHVLEGCNRAAIVVADGKGVAARMRKGRYSDIAVLNTEGGSAGLPVAANGTPRWGQRGFHPGFPQGRPGEATSRFLGADTLRGKGRGAKAEPVLAWAEVGRTEGLDGGLEGLSGAPVLDAAGQVVGVTLAEEPRRGRLYTLPPQVLHRVLRRVGWTPSTAEAGEPITIDNYGRAADGLRRDLRVAKVVCLGA